MCRCHPAESSSSTNSSSALFALHCHFVETRGRRTSWAAAQRGREKVSPRAAVMRMSKEVELTDIKGIEHVAGALGVVAASPYVDDVVDEHC